MPIAFLSITTIPRPCRPYEHKADWDESYSYFDVRPVLVFAADDSRYSFEDYFTENSFSDLIEAVEDLADDFEKMFDRYF